MRSVLSSRTVATTVIAWASLRSSGVGVPEALGEGDVEICAGVVLVEDVPQVLVRQASPSTLTAAPWHESIVDPAQKSAAESSAQRRLSRRE